MDLKDNRKNSNYSLNDLFDDSDSSSITEELSLDYINENKVQNNTSDTNDKLIHLVQRLNNNLEYICKEIRLLKTLTNSIIIFDALLTSYLIFDYVFN